MFLTPVSQTVRKSLGKTLRHMIVKTIPGYGHTAFRQLPENLWQAVPEVRPILRLIRCRKIIRIRQDTAFLLFRKPQRRLMRELRFIREDRGHGFPKFLSDRLVIFLMCFFDKSRHRLRIQRVQVGLIVEPTAVWCDLFVHMPYVSSLLRRLILRQTPIGNHHALFQHNLVAGHPGTIPLLGQVSHAGAMCLMAGRHVFLFPGRKY